MSDELPAHVRRAAEQVSRGIGNYVGTDDPVYAMAIEARFKSRAETIIAEACSIAADEARDAMIQRIEVYWHRVTLRPDGFGSDAEVAGTLGTLLDLHAYLVYGEDGFDIAQRAVHKAFPGAIAAAHRGLPVAELVAGFEHARSLMLEWTGE